MKEARASSIIIMRLEPLPSSLIIMVLELLI
jgi:hypothetical protein